MRSVAVPALRPGRRVPEATPPFVVPASYREAMAVGERNEGREPELDDLPDPRELGWPDPLADGDNEHLQAAVADDDSATRLIRSGLFLLRSLLETAPRPWGQVLTNDFAAVACFTRAYRQLRAATLLAHMGYDSEVSTLLRAAYEAGSVGRYLAKNPEKADKWVHKVSWSPKGTEGWIPDREVREWFGDTEERAYAENYRRLSRGTHPTAASVVPLLDMSEEGYFPRFSSVFDSERFQDALVQVLGIVLWTCFALKNAAANPDLIRPDWRHALSDYASDVGKFVAERTGAPVDYSHLQRDWEEEYARYDRILERIERGEAGQEIVEKHQEEFRRVVGDDLLRSAGSKTPPRPDDDDGPA